MARTKPSPIYDDVLEVQETPGRGLHLIREGEVVAQKIISPERARIMARASKAYYACYNADAHLSSLLLISGTLSDNDRKTVQFVLDMCREAMDPQDRGC